MFGRQTKAPKPEKTTNVRRGYNPSVIAEGMHVLGNIVSDGVLDIDGRIEGNVRGQTVTVRPNGAIRGDVVADTVHVHGTVEGLIKAKNVMLYADARVTGVIMHESLKVEDGAFVDGKFKRTDRLVLDDVDEKIVRRLRAPTIDTSFNNDNDNDEPQSEAEIKILENLRLIS